mmetsp:Transcript_97232/g.295220  ORF Transcript_97232/g.295220 Transcript_97232/m.295220 type:complete len:340 (-) Transcript_97232:37-1056(-)
MATQDVPFWLFNCAYLLFLSPVIYHLFQFHLSSDQQVRQANVLPWASEPFFAWASTSLFMVWMAMLGALLRIALAYLGWKQGMKPPTQHKDDFVRMAYLNVSLAVLARVQGRLEAREMPQEAASSAQCAAEPLGGFWWPELAFIVLVAFYATFFSLLFEMVRHINLHISADLANNLRGLWIMVVGVFVLLGVLHAHLQLAFAHGRSFGCAYLGWVALTLLGHVGIQLVPATLLQRGVGTKAGAGTHRREGQPSDHGGQDSQGQLKLHVHHWYWAFLAAHFTIFDTALSFVAQAIFLGVYIHGAACFGLEAIFEACPPPHPSASLERRDGLAKRSNHVET